MMHTADLDIDRWLEAIEFLDRNPDFVVGYMGRVEMDLARPHWLRACTNRFRAKWAVSPTYYNFNPNHIPPDLEHLRDELIELGPLSPCYIYFLLDGDEVVYVGQSRDNVEVRVRNHWRDKKQFNRVLFFICARDQLGETEGYYIKTLRPKYNVARNPDKTCATGGEA